MDKTTDKGACSATASDTAVCKAEIANCELNLCYKHSDATYHTACYRCKSGYKGGGTIDPVADYYPTCIANTIASCDIGSSTESKCLYCVSGSSVANDGKSCMAHSADTNCRMLGTGNSYCYVCWDAYYFNAKMCTLAGKIVGFIGAFAMAVYALY